MSAVKKGVRNGILSLAIKDKAVLYAAYMYAVCKKRWPFYPNQEGIRPRRRSVHAPELNGRGGKVPVAGKAIWITPKGAQGNRAAGIGVQLNDDDDMARGKIETYLAGALQSDRHTHTM